MKKDLFNYKKEIGVNYHAEVELNNKEKKFMTVYITVLFFVTLIVFILVANYTLPFYAIFIPFGTILIPFTYFIIKYFVLKKGPVHTESYKYKIDGNNIDVSNVQEKDYNNNQNNN